VFRFVKKTTGIKTEKNIYMIVSHFARNVGLDEETIKKYVQYQGRKDSGQHHKEM